MSNKEINLAAASYVPSGTTPVPSGTTIFQPGTSLCTSVPSGTNPCRPARMCSFDSFEKSAFLTPFECEFELGFNWKVVDLRVNYPTQVESSQSEFGWIL